jgi:hypothetical protein
MTKTISLRKKQDYQIVITMDDNTEHYCFHYESYDAADHKRKTIIDEINN